MTLRCDGCLRTLYECENEICGSQNCGDIVEMEDTEYLRIMEEREDLRSFIKSSAKKSFARIN